MLQLGLLLLRLLLLLLLLRQLPTAPHTQTHRRIESCRQTGGCACACTRGCMAAFGALLFWTPALHASRRYKELNRSRTTLNGRINTEKQLRLAAHKKVQGISKVSAWWASAQKSKEFERWKAAAHHAHESFQDVMDCLQDMHFAIVQARNILRDRFVRAFVRACVCVCVCV